MTAFDIAVPLVALGFAGIGILLLRREEHKLDRAHKNRHPAE
ncbi:hypothetical protein [Oceaniglobus indicus]|nr:hypothetical protein [Oceaniglobus indicus]